MTTSHHPTAGAPASNQFGVFQVHYATDKQVAFLKALFAKRDSRDIDEERREELKAIYAQVLTGKVNKKAASRGLDLLLAMPEKASAATATPAGPPASDKQVAFIKSLLGQKDTTGTPYAAPEWADLEANRPDKAVASAAITALLALPKAAAPAAFAGTPVEGMHFIDEQVIKVQRAVHGSGNLYAKVLVIDTEAELAEDGSVVTPAVAHFEYAPGVVNRVSEATLMTKEDGAKFGHLYGMCIKCAATLTDEVSIERGMGPICAGKGWKA